jgi:hypothetical protein
MTLGRELPPKRSSWLTDQIVRTVALCSAAVLVSRPQSSRFAEARIFAIALALVIIAWRLKALSPQAQGRPAIKRETWQRPRNPFW